MHYYELRYADGSRQKQEGSAAIDEQTEQTKRMTNNAPATCRGIFFPQETLATSLLSQAPRNSSSIRKNSVRRRSLGWVSKDVYADVNRLSPGDQKALVTSRRSFLFAWEIR